MTRTGLEGGKDWTAWHAAYDEESPLRHRLVAVQRRIREALLERPDGMIDVVSACAGEGLGPVRRPGRSSPSCRRSGSARRARPELASKAAANAPGGIDVVCADAGLSDPYMGAVPADVVLMCGVFGNITDQDVERTVQALPMLCRRDATVIWTRHRRQPDLTIEIRRWFGVAGFEPIAFDAPAEFQWTVGVNRFVADPVPIVAGYRFFDFVAREG